MAQDIKRHIEGRTQMLTFTLNGVNVVAIRCRLTADRFCPWLITQGAHMLPTAHTVRGKYLTQIFYRLT